MTYDPRSSTGIPSEPVGSLPRPMALQTAYAAYDEGKIDRDELEVEQEKAVNDSIARMEATGSPIVSDGEQRWSSFATYPFTDTLAGTGLSDTLAPGGQFFAIFADGHHRQLPRLTKGPFRYQTYASDTLSKAIRLASKPMKQAVISPSMLALLYAIGDDIEGYSREQFESDLQDECEKDIRGAFSAGAVRVSIDFTEGRLSCRKDPRNPWTGQNMLPHFVELINGVVDRFTAEERQNIGIHTCPGGDCDSVHSADVPYNDMLPSMFQINAGYFLIQLASERNREQVYRDIAASLREDANGVRQMAYIGVISPQNPRVESPEEVRDQIVSAANYIDKWQLGSTDDCGFSPFSIDVKPNHGSPDYARDVAFQKMESRIKGTAMAAEELGVH